MFSLIQRIRMKFIKYKHKIIPICECRRETLWDEEGDQKEWRRETRKGEGKENMIKVHSTHVAKCYNRLIILYD